MGRFERYRTYLGKGLLLHEVLLLLARAGLVIEPYRFYSEKTSEPVGPAAGAAIPDGVEFLEASPADTAALAALDPNENIAGEIRRDFSAGRRCFALRRGNALIAAGWCDLREIGFAPCRRPLAPTEAYLFRMMTLYEWRGRNLAPLLRDRTRRILRAEGREVAYSFTDLFNRPAIRFKEKVRATVERTGVYVRPFGMRGIDIRLGGEVNGATPGGRWRVVR